MKKLMFLAGMLISGMVSAQYQQINEMVVTPPSYNGEIFASLQDLLAHSVEYPSETFNAGLEGTEVIEFMINADGYVSEITVINSISSAIDKEILRVVNSTNGRWLPGIIDGKPVPMKKEVTLVFCLNGYENMVRKAVRFQRTGNNWLFAENDPQKALKYYEKALRLLPNEESLLALHGYTLCLLGDEPAAHRDWNRLKKLSNDIIATGEDSETLIRNFLSLVQIGAFRISDK